MTVPELRPRNASELVDATFQLARAHYVPLLVLSAIMTAPTLVVSVLASRVIREITVSGSALPGPGALGPQLATYAALLVASLWYFVIDGAMVWYAAEAYLGRTVEPAAALRQAFSRAGRLIGSNVARLLFIALGMLVPLIAIFVAAAGLGTSNMSRSPGTALVLGIVVLAAVGVMMGWLLFVFARYIVATPVLMLEEAGAIRALRRSSELMVGARRKTAVVLVLALCVYVALSLLASVPVGLMKATTASQLVRSLVQTLLYPLFACLVTLIYYDRRIRKEAFDIELMTSALGAEHGADAA